MLMLAGREKHQQVSETVGNDVQHTFARRERQQTHTGQQRARHEKRIAQTAQDFLPLAQRPDTAHRRNANKYQRADGDANPVGHRPL